MRSLTKIIGGLIFFSYLGIVPTAYAATQSKQVQGEIEFRVGSSNSTTVAGARIIVINHDGEIVASGLTDSRGTWDASVPYYEISWNKNFSSKGIVNAIVIANGYNEQAMFVVPITEHTVQPVVLQPIVPNERNLPSSSLGNYSKNDLQMYIQHYATEMKLKKQSPISGDPEHSPWGSEQR